MCMQIDYRLMNEFIEAIGEFKMKTQRISNLAPVSTIYVSLSYGLVRHLVNTF